MNDQQVSLLVLMDLSVAFDTVKHDKLISCLEEDLGITNDAIKCFVSYLENRSQPVSVNDGVSLVHSRSRKVCRNDHAWDLSSLLLH